MWTIQMLGGLAAHSPQREVTRFRTQKAASLLAFLAFHPAPQPRETLLDLLWPDADIDTGRHNLSNALSFLRHQLEPPGVPPGTVILADRTTVRLNPAAVATDVAAFETALEQANRSGLSEPESLSLLEAAVQQYQGTLLPGFYEEWIGSESQRLNSQFVQAVGQLIPQLLAAGRAEAAVSYARRAVTIDPLSDEAMGGLLQALSSSGQSGQALRAYRAFAQRLQEELDAQPSPDLQRLAQQFGQSGSPAKAPVLSDGGPLAEETLHIPRPRLDRIEPEEPEVVSAPVAPVPRARLLGGEFLLRTTTRFFGREEEIERLGKMLSTPRTRLVTLTGSGGTGKTRLALEVAAHLVERTAETSPADTLVSAVFVPLAPVTEAERLFDVTLRSLGIVPASNQDPLDQLAGALASRPNTLLVLDNFEQLVEEGTLHVDELLGKSAGVKVLVTSRQKLDIEGEHEYHLAPLPTSAGVQTPEALLNVASIALFVDRAQSVLPDFQLTERNAVTIAQLCDYLEGLPLAIELAAARVGVLSPARILEQVQTDRLGFLATRHRDAESRHKTLRATLDWSYQLLPEAGQRFLAQVSVFRGGWTLKAAEAVCGLNEEETLEMLTLLRDSSLIGVSDTEEGLRFTLLETIREYGQEKLLEWGENSVVRCRHRDYFVVYAEQAEPELTGPDQAMWLNCLETEHSNLCAVIEWCEADMASAEVGLRLVWALSDFWEVRGYWSLGRGYLARALSRAEASAPTLERAKALQGAGGLANLQGDYASARALNEESLAIYRELGDKRGIAHSLSSLGSVAYRQSDFEAARTLYEQALAIRQELGDQRGIAESLSSLGSVAYNQGDFEAARTLNEQGLLISRELGDQRRIADSLSSLGSVADKLGDFEAARTLLQESLAISRELGDKICIAICLYCLGNVAYRQGDYETARTRLQESLVIFRETGHYWIIHVLRLLGHVERAAEDYARASAFYQESLRLSREQGDVWTIAGSLEDFAGLAGRQGRWERAVRLLGGVEALCATLGRTLPFGQKEYERTVAATRAALSEEAFAAAWQQGRAMTLEHAVAYALRGE